MIALVIILMVFLTVLEAISLNTSFQNIGFEFHTDRKSGEPDETFYMIQKASNYSSLPVTYLKSRIIFPRSGFTAKNKAVIINSFERRSTSRFFLMPHRSVTRKTPLTLSERGVYWFEEADLVRGDFLGLKTGFTRTWGYAGIVIYPRRLTDSRSVETLSGITGDFLSRPFLMRDPILSIGVREYTGNEPMNAISWKKSASSAKLMVRENDYTRERSCIICVLGNEEADEWQMELCARIGRTVAEMLAGQSVDLEFYTNAYLQALRPFEIHHARASRTMMDVLLDQLARLRPGECAAQEKLLESIISAKTQLSECILIAPCENEAVHGFIRSFEQMSRSRCTPVYADDFTENLS